MRDDKVAGDDVNGSLPRAYRIWIFDDLDVSWDIAFAIPSEYRPERSGCVLMIEDGAGNTWDVKVFDMKKDRDCVFSTSDPNIFCAVAGKIAYFIDARKPDVAVNYGTEPDFHKLLPDVALGQVIYFDDHGLKAFGPTGKLWETSVGGCGITDVTFEGAALTACVMDYDGESTWTISVNRTTGELVRTICAPCPQFRSP